MAVKHICDGFDVEISGEPCMRGHVIRREYCAEAAKIVDEYQAEIDALHERVAKTWTDELEAIRERYRKIVRALPDDNYEGGDT